MPCAAGSSGDRTAASQNLPEGMVDSPVELPVPEDTQQWPVVPKYGFPILSNLMGPGRRAITERTEHVVPHPPASIMGNPPPGFRWHCLPALGQFPAAEDPVNGLTRVLIAKANIEIGPDESYCWPNLTIDERECAEHIARMMESGASGTEVAEFTRYMLSGHLVAIDAEGARALPPAKKSKFCVSAARSMSFTEM